MESEPVRVASVVEELFVGGDENRLLTLSAKLNLAEFKHLVVVICPIDTANPRTRRLYDAFRNADIELAVLGHRTSALRGTDRARSKAPWWEKLATYIRVVRDLAALLRERQIEVVDARLSLPTVIAVLAAPLARTKTIVSTVYSPSVWAGAVRQVLGQLTYSRVDAIISDSAATIDAYERWLFTSRAKTVMIPNGVDPPERHNNREAIRRQIGVPDVLCPVILQVARFIPFKGYETLLLAAATVLQEEPTAFFVFCGFGAMGPYGDILKAQARALGILEQVRMISWSGEIADVFGASDIFVHASSFDSSPMAILESMASGLPAVVTNVGGIPELVDHERTGIVIEPNDPRALVTALLRLLQDRDLRNRLGKAALKRHGTHYTSDRMARATERLFASLARGQ